MSEIDTKLEQETPKFQAAWIGETALWGAGVFKRELGVNDPLTHLEQYLECGEAAIESIDEDLITDIAERKIKPTFVNRIVFDEVGGDFISRENKFSMRDMTQITEAKFSRGNTADMQQYQRAKIESNEVERLGRWFDGAEFGDLFIVESLPLGDERYTIVRIYEKVGDGELVEHVITLHNATVRTFNQLHGIIGAETPNSSNELELLNNMYAYRPDESNFIEEYVSVHDNILAQINPGQEFKFGLETKKDEFFTDDIDNVRRQTALRTVYLNTLRTLGRSNGKATSEIISASSELGCSFSIYEGDSITGDLARELLSRSLQSVAATFDRASKAEMETMAASQDAGLAAGFAGYYGGEARAEGVTYDGACPSSLSPSQAEANVANKAYRANQDPSQCGTCPQCKKEYFVPDELYKKKILHCKNCKATVSFGGSKVDKNTMAKYLNQEKSPGILDIFFDSLAEYNRKLAADQAAKRAKPFKKTA